MPEDVDEIDLDVPDSGELTMAALDENSFLHWKEHLYKSTQRMSDGADFVTEQGRMGMLEGKMGVRETVGLRNVPPVAADAKNTGGN